MSLAKCVKTVSLPAEIVAFDTETSGLNPWRGDAPFAISFCWPDGTDEYFSFAVDPFTRKVQKPNAPQLRRIREILENPHIAKVGHNVKFDVWMVEVNWGIKVRGEIHDTLFMAHACNSLEPTLELKRLASKYLKIPNDDELDLQKRVNACRREARKLGWKIDEETKADYWLPAALGDGEACREYCVLDTHRTIRLYQMFSAVMQTKHLHAAKTYQRELKLWPITKAIEGRGVKVDLAIVEKEIAWCQEQEKTMRINLVNTFGEFGKEVSSDKMRKYLFTSRKSGGLGLTPDPKRLTKETRQPQVTADVLEKLEGDVPIVRTHMNYKRTCKARQTYYQNYLDGAIAEQNYFVLHANFNQVGPVTGRYSCRNPNLMNVPKRAPAGDVMQRVRLPFGPRPGYTWLHLDYKAIEARIFAEEAGELDMLRIFANDGDVYQELVDRIIALTGIDLVQLLSFADSAGKPGSGARQICKNNFLGWTYGEGFEKMARAMRLLPEAAKEVIAALKAAYPRAMPFMKQMQRMAEQQGYVINRYGRKVPIEKPLWKDGDLYEFNYKATNYLIQSTAADMLKTAMIECARFLEKMDAHIVLTIHDELVFEINKKLALRPIAQKLGQIMQTAAEEHFRRVRFPVDANITREHWSVPEKYELN